MQDTQTTSEKGKILVVDDNLLLAKGVESLLTNAEYTVTVCSNGVEAIAALENNPFDLIICDVMMPEMGGYELHQSVRNHQQHSHIPFVFLTALGESQEIEKGKEIGADDYLVKPFEPKNLLSVVRGKLTRSRSLRKQIDEKYDAYRRKILHTLSHEFRTPLVAINTGAELLLDPNPPAQEKMKNLLQAIHRSGQRLEQLVTDFMLVQQLEAGVAEKLYHSHSKTITALELVEELVYVVNEDLRVAGFNLAIKNFVENEQVKVYLPQIIDCIKRIGSNAMKFSKESKEVVFQVSRVNAELMISIEDFGVGFKEDEMKKASELFVQIGRERMEQQGGGIGLTVASRYAHIHGGRSGFVCKPEGGAVVSLYLPIVTA